MKIRRLIWGISGIAICTVFISSNAVASDVKNGVKSLPFFKSICVTEDATGFNWVKGKWKRVNFRTETKWIVQKMDASMIKDSMGLMVCKPEKKMDFDGGSINEACYNIKKMGDKSSPLLDYQMCTEIIKDNSLYTVNCRNFTFHPDGGFIANPTALNIELHPKDDYKDSLILSVGICSSVTE